MKLVIFGSRNAYPSFQDISAALRRLHHPVDISTMKEHKVTEVVCGGARGADECGADWARQHGIPVKMFPADWNKHGKAAGFIRNREMAEYADLGIAFWKNESSGTANMIAQMVSFGKTVVIA